MEESKSKNTWVFNSNDDGPKLGKLRSETLYRVITFLIGCVGLSILSATLTVVVAIFLPGILQEDSPDRIIGLTLINSLQYLLLIGGLCFFLWPRFFVLVRRFKNWANVIIGLGFGAAVIGITLLYSYLISSVVDPGSNNNQVAAESIITSFPGLSIFILGFVGPICEELTYRFGLFGALKRKSRILAYIVSAIVFGFIHFDFTGNLIVELLNLPTYILCGLLFGLAYDFFGIEASITAHVTNNIYAVIVTLINQ